MVRVSNWMRMSPARRAMAAQMVQNGMVEEVRRLGLDCQAMRSMVKIARCACHVALRNAYRCGWGPCNVPKYSKAICRHMLHDADKTFGAPESQMEQVTELFAMLVLSLNYLLHRGHNHKKGAQSCRRLANGSKWSLESRGFRHTRCHARTTAYAPHAAILATSPTSFLLVDRLPSRRKLDP